MTTVYFVRHAFSDKTVRDDRTRPLTAEGLADSENVAELLKNRNIDIIISSPYKRSIDTVGSLARALNKEIITDEAFRERNAGNWFGENFLEFIEKQWADFNYHIPEGESLASVQERNIGALRKVLAEHGGKNIVIATHGTALSTIINYFDRDYNFKSFMRILNFMPYVVKMEFDGERFLGMSEELVINKNW
ncbi:MAG: histidine phosphatase family protein [Oscillospiraceae bacterium]|nr:histidine phosphatase family protein [Oscillospiraceae bacterium]